MNRILIAAAVACMTTVAMAQTPAPKDAPAKSPPMAAPAIPAATLGMTCKTQAADKKLAGAAMTSFMKKCQTDASKSCETETKTQNLKGAAKTRT